MDGVVVLGSGLRAREVVAAFAGLPGKLLLAFMGVLAAGPPEPATAGRRATREAYLHLGKQPPAAGQAGLFE